MAGQFQHNRTAPVKEADEEEDPVEKMIKKTGTVILIFIIIMLVIK